MLILVIWLLFGVCAAVVASQRGASGCLWFGIGVLLGPLGWALAFTQGKTCRNCGKKINAKAAVCPYCRCDMYSRSEVALVQVADDLKACPFCAEDIKVAAIKCKHCGAVLEDAESASDRAELAASSDLGEENNSSA